MEKIYKKIFFYLSTFFVGSTILLSTSAFALDGLNGAGWSISAGLEYRQFSNNGTTFAESFNHKLFNISPSFHLGYDFGIAYNFPGTATYANLDFHHLRSSDTKTVWTDVTLFPGVLNLGPVTWARAKLTFDYDSVDLTGGQWVGVSSLVYLDLHGGLNFTHLKKRMDTFGSGFGNTFNISGGTTFNGVGPTFGVDAYASPFPAYQTFSIYGGMDTSFVYGSMSGFVNIDDNGVFTSDDIPDERIVVPILGGKIGLDFQIPYQGMMWDIRAEYELKQFFGITRDSNYSSSINASFQGPSFRVRLTF